MQLLPDSSQVINAGLTSGSRQPNNRLQQTAVGAIMSRRG
jgi:hypothetical protein